MTSASLPRPTTNLSCVWSNHTRWIYLLLAVCGIQEIKHILDLRFDVLVAFDVGEEDGLHTGRTVSSCLIRPGESLSQVSLRTYTALMAQVMQL